MSNPKGVNAHAVQEALSNEFDDNLPFDKIANQDEVMKLVDYMKENHLNIAQGSYWIGEHFSFDRKFIPQ